MQPKYIWCTDTKGKRQNLFLDALIVNMDFVNATLWELAE